jgi:NAD dependent epimerase/dehydratase family enzyme
MLPPFKLGLGGPWGPGTQWWSWIHQDDAVGLMLFALERSVPGAVNVASPAPVAVNEFARTLGDVLGRPAFVRAPAFALRLALGEAAEAILASLRVVPRRALDAGYAFRFPTLREALTAVV